MKLAAFAIVLVVVLAAVTVDAAALRTKKLPLVSDSAVKLLWKSTVGDNIGSACHYNASNDWLYVNGGSEVAILHGSTGTKIRSVPSTATVGGVSDIVFGDNGKIYFTAGYSVYCRDAETLELVWNHTGSGEFQSTVRYVSSQRAVYLNSWVSNKIYKLDADTGSLLWSFTGKGDGVGTHVSYSQKYDLVFSGTASGVEAVTKDGQQAWYFATSCSVYTKPILSDDEDSLYFGCGMGLYAVDTSTGSKKWKAALADSVGLTPLLDKGTLYIATSSTCYAVDATAGHRLWSSYNCSAGPTDLAAVRKYGDAMVFTAWNILDGNGLQGVALNGSGLLWSWAGASVELFSIMTPQPDGKMWIGDIDGSVYALQLPPTTSPGGAIKEKHCTDAACSQDCVTQDYSTTKCVQTSSSQSLKRQCLSNGNLRVQEYPQSPSCDKFSQTIEAEYAPGKCYQDGFGGSVEVVSCSA